MQCVILAGGLGMRMRPATETMPKALLPVAGEPFAAHQLRLLRRGGVTDVVYCIAHLGEQVRAFVGDGGQFGLNVTYVDEGEQLMGTAGALRLASDAGVLHDHFLVVYGDSYLPIDLRPVEATFARLAQPALMTVFHNRGQWVPSNVIFDGRSVVRYDKRAATGMEWVDYGLSVLDADLVTKIPAGDPVDLADVFRQLSAAGRLAGLEVDERFYEVGSPSGLQELEAVLELESVRSSEAPLHAPGSAR
jgi:N-acetyl-alpha-D-muramate 1-phosphate uridylyltransferase